MSTGKIHVSRDVVFRENIFPFNDSLLNTTGSPISLLQSPHFIDILDDFDKNGTQDTLNSSKGPNAACDLSPNLTVSSPSISPAPLLVNQPRRSTRYHKLPKYMNDYVGVLLGSFLNEYKWLMISYLCTLM